MSAAPASAPPESEPEDHHHGGPEMSLIEHLKELRNRVIFCAIAVVGGSLVSFVVWETILGWLLAPARVNHPGYKLSAFSPTEVIGVIFKIGLYGGLVIGSPVMLPEQSRFTV